MQHDPQVFTYIPAEELHGIAEAKKAEGWRFVNMHACALGETDNLELVVTFSHGLDMENYKVELKVGDSIPTITDLFLNAFVFENETHDLYGITFDGLVVDFGGKFYRMSLETPMSPTSLDAKGKPVVKQGEE